MDDAKLKELRNMLYKTALIGYLLTIFSVIFCYFFYGFVSWLCQFFMHLPATEVPMALILLIGVFKIVAIGLFLIPALGIHLHLLTTK